jgi:tRNA A37 threonylcarbamoyladenosine synthetase subunit TsaC/SUA5/YrdC
MFDDSIFLTNTDTTVGFISKNREKLYEIKNRDKQKAFITVCSSNIGLKTLVRVPRQHKKLVRNSQKTTFVFKNKNIAIRVIKNTPHADLINRLNIAYSTSANISKQNFDISWATKESDVVIYNKEILKQKEPSKIILLSNSKMKKIR